MGVGNNEHAIRLPWVDITKCILIVCVIVYHIPVFAEQHKVGGMEFMYSIRPIFQCYFIPAFFLLTGFCSSFRAQSITQYVWKNFKQLMIPNFLITVLIPIISHALRGTSSLNTYMDDLGTFFCSGGYWFLTSLFFGKIVYMLMRRLIASHALLASFSFVFMIIGIWTTDILITNFLYFENTLTLLFFLWIGDYLKNIYRMIFELKFFVISSILFALIISFSLIFSIEIPFVTLHVTIKYSNVLLFLMISLLGSMMIIGLSQCIGENRIMQYLGKNSLVIYLFHMYFLLKVLPHLSLMQFNNVEGLLIGLLLIVITLAFCIVMNTIINTKYLKWILGKF